MSQLIKLWRCSRLFHVNRFPRTHFCSASHVMVDSKAPLIIDIMKETVNTKKPEKLVWVDLEMTGLDVEKDHIIEIACLVTDWNLEIIGEGPNIVISQPVDVMDSMNEWCREQHGKSGLTEAVLKSTTTLAQAEKQVLDFLQQHTESGTAPLAGNSVYMDRMFLLKYMPSLTDYLHYRIIDVSTVKELCRRWFPDQFQNAPVKTSSHRALDDIKESVKELQYYKQNIFQPGLIQTLNTDSLGP